jgi:hypothetical protein
MQLAQAKYGWHHLAAGVVDMLQRLFGERDGLLDELDEFRLAVLDARRQQLREVFEPIGVAPGLAILDKAVRAGGLFDHLAQGRQPRALRQGSRHQQLLAQGVVAPEASSTSLRSAARSSPWRYASIRSSSDWLSFSLTINPPAPITIRPATPR